MKLGNLQTHEGLKAHLDARRRQLRRDHHAQAHPPRRLRPTVEDAHDVDTLVDPLSSSDAFWYQRPQDNMAAGGSGILPPSPLTSPSDAQLSFDMQAALAGEFDFSAGTEDSFNTASGLTLEDILSGAGLLESITAQNVPEDGYISGGEELDGIDCEEGSAGEQY